MKSRFFIFSLLLIAKSVFSQSTTVGSCNNCLSTDNLLSKRFYVSHGITSATQNTGTAWAHHNIYMESASVYNNFDFEKDVEYCIEVEFELSKQGLSSFNNHKFHIRAANHLRINTAGALPTISNTDLIFEELYTSGRFNLNTTYKLRTVFKPTADYKQIWFYVTTSTNGPTARFIVKNITIRQQGSKAKASFVNPDRIEKMHSKYGTIDVAVLCLNDPLLVDGSKSTCENGYFIELSEFNLTTWTDTRILHSNWVSPLTTAPNNIRITDFLPQGYQLRSNKIYKFRLAVGPEWDTKDLWFKIDCCGPSRRINTNDLDERQKNDIKRIKN